MSILIGFIIAWVLFALISLLSEEFDWGISLDNGFASFFITAPLYIPYKIICKINDRKNRR